MDEIRSLLFNPDFQLGVIAGLSLGSVLFLLFVSLAELRGRYIDRRRGSALDEIEHFQRTGEAIRYGSHLPPHRAPPPEAANDATLDLREAYRRPRSARAEMRGGPR